jgi:hypothetical protein
MNENLRADLWKLYGHLLPIAEKTVTQLGEDDAWFFVELANDWFDVGKAVSDGYPEEQKRSLLFFDLRCLTKDINWLQLHFLAGNYPQVYRTLRFVWELSFRGYYADNYPVLWPGKGDVPGPSGDEKPPGSVIEKQDSDGARCSNPSLASSCRLTIDQRLLDGITRRGKHSAAVSIPPAPCGQG